jgi:Ca-activated chloride channel family protein
MRANDLLLRQVPDDPAGLLRERLMLQYLRRHGQLR